jgi:glycosyltransferase involved in cell wall biosynthesis
MIVHDLVLATRGKLTGIERFAINTFEAAREGRDDVFALVASDDLLKNKRNVISVGHGMLSWIRAASKLPNPLASADLLVCAAFPPSPSMLRQGGSLVRVLHDEFAWTRSASLSFQGRLMFKHYEQRLLARYDRIFCPTEPVRRALQGLFPASRFRVCGNAPGIRFARTSARPVDHLIGKPFRLMVGTIEPRKNYERLVRLADLAPEQLFVVVGRPGWGGASALMKSAPPNVVWLTDCDDDQVAWLYGSCDLFLSLSHAEGFNMPLVEAGMAGCKILYSDIDVHREVAISTARSFGADATDEEVLQQMVSHHERPWAELVEAYKYKFSWSAVANILQDRG